MQAQHETQTLAATAGDVLDAAVDSWSMASPQVRVRLGATMAASVVFARGRMPAIPAVLAAVGVGVLAERAYVLVHDVHLAALAITVELGDEAAARRALIDDSPLQAFRTGALPDLAAAARDMPGELRRPGSKRAADRDKGRDTAENDERCPVV